MTSANLYQFDTLKLVNSKNKHTKKTIKAVGLLQSIKAEQPYTVLVVYL